MIYQLNNTSMLSIPLAFRSFAVAVVVTMSMMVPAGHADGTSILVQSTTSTANSGLYEHLLPLFKATSGITVNVVAVGTGQAIRNAENCDADVLLVHAKAAEEAFVQAGFGIERVDLMYNDFVLVGPAEDPADIAGVDDVASALVTLAQSKALFASRGDDSGTHKAELRLWEAAGIDPTPASGQWYRETGSGMGATLNTAIGLGAYAMTDRATWISFANKGDHQIMVEGDTRLFNQYGVIRVSEKHCPDVNTNDSQQFIDWLLSDDGTTAINNFEVAGQQLFFANASAL